MKLNIPYIKRLKKQSGMTWEQVAKKAGLKERQNIHYYLTGKICVSHGAELFAKVFKVKAKDLIK